MERTIQIFVTGGTFDKRYDYLRGTLTFGETHVNDMLQRGRCTVPVEVRTLMMIDSLDMTEVDRQTIGHNVARTPHERVVITHGSDTMVETAAFLAKLELSNKTIILTGAMVPYAFGTSSDGFFNLGSAISYAQLLDAGVYVAMNGRAFAWHEVRKNRSTGFFEALND